MHTFLPLGIFESELRVPIFDYLNILRRQYLNIQINLIPLLTYSAVLEFSKKISRPFSARFLHTSEPPLRKCKDYAVPRGEPLAKKADFCLDNLPSPCYTSYARVD